jgi:hypothetical protein
VVAVVEEVAVVVAASVPVEAEEVVVVAASVPVVEEVPGPADNPTHRKSKRP